MNDRYVADILSQKLKEGRKYRGLDQKDIAEVLNIHISTYNKYELGERKLNAITIPIIANFEQLDINFYFTKDMSPKQADLDVNEYVSPLEKAQRKIIELEQLSSQKEDPLLVKVRSHLPLYELVQMIQHWPGNWLNELKAMAFGYFGSKEEAKKGTARTA